MNNKRKNPKQKDNRVKGETETFGVDPSTLARWAEEEAESG